MNKLFHRLSTRILLGILLAAAISAVVYTAANGALKAFFQYYAMQPEVFQRLSDEHFADLQDFATENHIVSTDGKPFTQWNDKYHYVSLMVIRQNEGLCYNSFVSYNMTYTEEDSQTFFWGSKVLPTYEYQLQLEDETCKVYFSGYFDQAYTSLRKAICGVLFVASFVTAFFLLFQKYIRYIGEMEQNVSSLCNKNFSQQIPIRYKTELSTLAANINHLGDTIQLLLLTEDAKLKQKEQFVKSIAHDIRTPLTVVIGYLELLSSGPAISQEMQKKYIDIAYVKAKRLEKLIEDLFGFTKMNYGKISMNVGKVDIVKLLGQLLEEFYPSFADKDLTYELKSNVPSQIITADGNLLARLFDNLINNAIKYGAEGKKVLIQVFAKNDIVTVSVTNYGYVIPAEELPLIFNKFYRVEQSRSSKTGGTGLGLAIAKNIVDMHGGTISVASDLNGTVFTVKLKVDFDVNKENFGMIQ